MSAVDVVIGLQRGDEGKGRFVDLLAKNYDIIARGNGGANAGHTVVPEGIEPLALHQVPSGIAYSGKMNVIGNGVYLDPLRLGVEIADVFNHGLTLSPQNLAISDIAHLVLPHHVALDTRREAGATAQGSTKAGIAYVARDKYLREGVRAELLLTGMKELRERIIAGLENISDNPTTAERADFEMRADEWIAAAQKLVPYITDTVALLNQAVRDGKKILAEGAQAHWLDINHGMYPAVTSSSTTVNGLLDGIGLSARHLGSVTGVAKVIKSHVGGGPFVTEILDQTLAASIRGEAGKVDSEYGATTKRPRRIGYFDLVELKNAVDLNGVTELALSKIDQADRYGSEMKVATSYSLDTKKLLSAPSSAVRLAACTPNYETLKTWTGVSEMRQRSDLPKEAIEFVEMAQNSLGVPVTKIGVGPERDQVILD